MGYDGTVYSYWGNGSVVACHLTGGISLGAFENLSYCFREISLCCHRWHSEFSEVTCRGWYSDLGHCHYSIPCCMLDSCSGVGKAVLGAFGVGG